MPVRQNRFQSHFNLFRILLGKTRMPGVILRRVTFPVSEGIGVFIGVIAWDLLSEGRMDILKALIVAVPVALVWFCVRCWNARSTGKKD